MDNDICGHTYSRTLAQKTFRCTLQPHPKTPDAHYFEAVIYQAPQPGRLVSVPGER